MVGSLSVWAESAHTVNYDDIAKGELSARTVRGLRPMADGEHYTTLDGGNVLRWRYATGKLVDTLFAAPADFPRVEGYELSDDESTMLLVTGRVPIYRHSARFLIVCAKMLYGRAHVVFLHAVHIAHAHTGRKIWIFAQILKVAPVVAERQAAGGDPFAGRSAGRFCAG